MQPTQGVISMRSIFSNNTSIRSSTMNRGRLPVLLNSTFVGIIDSKLCSHETALLKVVINAGPDTDSITTVDISLNLLGSALSC